MEKQKNDIENLSIENDKIKQKLNYNAEKKHKYREKYE